MYESKPFSIKAPNIITEALNVRKGRFSANTC